MRGVRRTFDLEHLVELHRQGVSLEDIGQEVGASVATVWAHLRRAGVDTRRRPVTLKRRKSLDGAAIAAAYAAGASEKALAEHYGVGRRAIRLRLSEAGTEIRGRGAAQQLRIDQMTDEQIGLLVRNAHLAFDAATEVVLDGMLRERGLYPIPQLPTGRYNLDRALPPVAMEVHQRAWSPLDPAVRRGHERKRIQNLTDWGWHVHYTWIRPGEPITDGAADDLVAFYERTHRLPAAPGEYRVIRGSGEFVAAGRDNLD